MIDKIKTIIRQARANGESPFWALVDYLTDQDASLPEAKRLAREWMVKYG